jgi:hypothetical protein
MTRNKFTIIACLVALTILTRCGSTGELYSSYDKNKIYTGTLSDSSFISLKQFLIKTTNSQLNDTIIIKYDYNNETCWDMLDQKDEDYVKPFIPAHHERIRNILAVRKNVSIFEFREPGQNLNKIKKWDYLIKIDSTLFLFNLLFKERCTCGSSIIVMPDRNFVFVRSDSHSEAVDYTNKQIATLLTKK